MSDTAGLREAAFEKVRKEFNLEVAVQKVLPAHCAEPIINAMRLIAQNLAVARPKE